MKFIIILDNKSNPTLLDKITSRIKQNINDNDISFDVFILKDSIPIDSDSNILINILINESFRAPIIMDYEIAKHYPEIIKNQHTIIALDDSKINENILESLISTSAGIDNFGLENVAKTTGKLSVIDLSKFYISEDYYVHLYKIYKNEYLTYPTILLSRDTITKCNGNFDKLVGFFNDRNNNTETIGWKNTNTKNKSYKKYKERFNEFQNTSICSYSDERLKTRDEQIVFKSKNI